MVAWVLTREFGRVVTAAELWHGWADAGPALLPADADMQAPWSRSETLRLLDDWVIAGLIDRRTFLAISGAALTTIAADYLAAEPAAVTSALAGGGVSDRCWSRSSTACRSCNAWMTCTGVTGTWST
jgi:hypothetical protein